MKPHLKTQLTNVSDQPGVYLMKDSLGDVLYVGKARNLRKRLSSYFSSQSGRGIKTTRLIEKIDSFETIITETEKEALILESNLIKRHRPHYNVILKDDKRYPSLRLDITQDHPSLEIVRKIKKDGALYFGPFTSAQAVRQTLKIINKTFRIRKCRSRAPKTRNRPCLHCQMDGCLAPCCRDVDRDEYHAIIQEVIQFLKGRTPRLIKKIRTEMMAAAEVQDFEKAAMLRNKMFALEKTLEKQISVTTDFKDRDIIGLARSLPNTILTLLYVRGGFLVGMRHFHFTETLDSEPDTIAAFIRQYYAQNHFIPEEIIVPLPIEDRDLMESWLNTRKGARSYIKWPQRGEKVKLIQMANQNANNELKDVINANAQNQELLQRLQRRLKLSRFPDRIECLDNSNLGGSNAVAGLVVYEKGRPAKSMYRKYRVKTVTMSNDYATMAEILQRRFKKKGGSREPYPDLLMLDGGKGQLNIACEVIDKLKLEHQIDLISIAKKDINKKETADKIYKPGRRNPITFGKEPDLLLFLQQIRDEAHRYAVTFHRHRRTKSALRSQLDTIPGIGKKRKQLLLTHFGSIKKIRAAAPEEICQLPGINIKIAEAVKKALGG